MTENVPMVIDVHAHHYPKQYLERIGRPGLPPAAAAALAYQDIGQRLELLDRVGIDPQVPPSLRRNPTCPRWPTPRTPPG